MALANKTANKAAEGVDYVDLLKFNNPKLAQLFVQALCKALSSGNWITFGHDQNKTVGLITLKNSNSVRLGTCSFHNVEELEAALEEFAGDVAALAASKAL